jgi:Na+-driven multidrug efflux pump
MDVLVGFLRGIGYSIIPMIVSLIGVCALRVIWIYTIFAQEKTLDSLYISYPISWTVTVITLVLLILYFFPKVKKKLEARA